MGANFIIHGDVFDADLRKTMKTSSYREFNELQDRGMFRERVINEAISHVNSALVYSIAVTWQRN